MSFTGGGTLIHFIDEVAEVAAVQQNCCMSCEVHSATTLHRSSSCVGFHHAVVKHRIGSVHNNSPATCSGRVGLKDSARDGGMASLVVQAKRSCLVLA